jgi:hypothetical protein
MLLMRRILIGFCIAAAIPLTINLVMLALLGKDSDQNRFWMLLNLPGLPCGLALVLFVRSEYGAFVATFLGSCLFYGAIGAAIAKWTAKRRVDRGPPA